MAYNNKFTNITNASRVYISCLRRNPECFRKTLKQKYYVVEKQHFEHKTSYLYKNMNPEAGLF